MSMIRFCALYRSFKSSEKGRHKSCMKITFLDDSDISKGPSAKNFQEGDKKFRDK